MSKIGSSSSQSVARTRRGRFGFTLVELLVVIAIIGVLIALLLPAVQAAREAARRIQCQNQLKQLTLACIAHHDAIKAYPAGGWGVGWAPDPDSGSGKKQPGSHFYGILPYHEQQNLYDLGSGGTWAEKFAANKERLSVPVDIWFCPTRRSPIALPLEPGVFGSFVYEPYFSDRLDLVSRNDYVGNAGDFFDQLDILGGTPGFSSSVSYSKSNPDASWEDAKSASNFPDPKAYNGIFMPYHPVTVNQVTDGTSQTYMFGEKSMNPLLYETDRPDLGDNEGPLVADERDPVRWTTRRDYPLPPTQDRPQFEGSWRFGSAHPGIVMMSFCDGSVHAISLDVSEEVHIQLGNRRDGAVVDSSEF